MFGNFGRKRDSVNFGSSIEIKRIGSLTVA